MNFFIFFKATLIIGAILMLTACEPQEVPIEVKYKECPAVIDAINKERISLYKHCIENHSRYQHKSAICLRASRQLTQ